jgi:hypothetical protein
MDTSETPEEFLALRRGAYINSLEARREELKLKQTPELRGILRKFRKVLEADT